MLETFPTARKRVTRMLAALRYRHTVASEWLGVIGTGVGAAIGGVVTVASLWIKGGQEAAARREMADREDRLRAEDRAWSVKQRNVDERRAKYAELVDTARRITNNMGAIRQHHLSPPEQRDGLIQFGREVTQEALDQFRRLRSQAVLTAVGRSVLTTADEFFGPATVAFTAMTGPDPTPVPIEDVLALVRVAEQLENACRHDLGLDPDDPATSSTGSEAS